jgi:hypothetical protein
MRSNRLCLKVMQMTIPESLVHANDHSCKLDFFCSFGDGKFGLYRHSNMIASGFLSVMNNIYDLNTITSNNETLNNKT